MTDLIVYSAKVAVCITILYLPFILILRNETHFLFNRAYLLFALVFSLFIPMFRLQGLSNDLQGTMSFMLNEIRIEGNGDMVKQNDIPVMNLVALIYLMGLIFLTTRFVFMLCMILSTYRQSKMRVIKGIKVAVCQNSIAPFSFMGTIFISSDDVRDEDLEQVLMHEIAHIRQAHSMDIILSELICLLTWYNPVSWMIKYSLKEMHEYIADSKVMNRSSRLADYFMLLTRNTAGVQLGLANNFNKSLTLKRLIMMKKQRSGRLSRLKALTAAPLIIMLLMIFSCGNNAGEANSQNLKDTTLAEKKDTVIDKMPEFPGGSEAMTKFIVSNVKYPEAAKEKGIEGKVMVNFVVTKSGKVDEVKVTQKVNDLLDAEAIRVIKAMPDWIPGEQKGKKIDVQMILPIQFKLS